MEDEEKTRRNDMYNKLLGMNLCPGLSEEAALEIGVGSIEILGSKACDALQRRPIAVRLYVCVSYRG